MGQRHASILGSLSSPDLQPRTVYAENGLELGLSYAENGTRLAVLASPSSFRLGEFEGETSSYRDRTLLVGPASSRNAAALRASVPWLRPRTLGLETSAGLGDRLGIATPGHVRAMRAAGGGLTPIFAQQSIREMERTGRSPREVMDDATWGVFAEGWEEGFGADADHLKTTDHIDACLAAGYTFFTFDPGKYVEDAADSASPGKLQNALADLPWDRLEDSAADLRSRYLGRSFEFEGHVIAFDERTLSTAAVKYGQAVAQVAEMFRHLEQSSKGEFEVEVSVDETASPTTHAQHVYIAGELRRLGVSWVSLAPRYIGTFEKGVDYIGDPEEFERDFAVHAAIARELGPYKLSLHSGSDKFSIYPAAARQSRGMVHLKTAGTSYLEALRTLSRIDAGFFREIYAFARECYEEDRASYHVSAELEAAPEPQEVGDAELPGLLEQFDAREILHVTFGSVLRTRTDNSYRRYERFMELLQAHPEAYAADLEAHFLRHLEPFSEKGSS